MTDIRSESDARTSNNSVRHNYRVLSDEEKAAMVAIKDAGAVLLDLINANVSQKAGREAALARTKTEEAVMWAVKGLTG